ncbi:MAG TPA: hypothetical protein VFG37_15465 [Planctomycetota bacterium]|nr:hypothetical protein [Planctomycetota bacterium]
MTPESTGVDSVAVPRSLWRRLDRASLAGIAAGLALELQPFWDGGLRAGFCVLFAAVVVQIVSSHAAAPTAPATAAAAAGRD